MNIFVHDPHNWISKTQKQKLKEFCRARTMPIEPKDVLDSVHYQNEKERYNRVTIDSDDENLHLRFTYVDYHDKLRRAIRDKKMTRVVQQDERWRLYFELKQRLGKQHILPEQAFPDPDDIQKNPSMYRDLLDKIPNSPIRRYLEICL
jgi:hypothetical protein